MPSRMWIFSVWLEITDLENNLVKQMKFTLPETIHGDNMDVYMRAGDPNIYFYMQIANRLHMGVVEEDPENPG